MIYAEESLIEGVRVRIVRSEDQASQPMVLILPGDAPDGWRGSSATTISERLIDLGIPSVTLIYDRLQINGSDLCPLGHAVSACNVLASSLNNSGTPLRAAIASSFGAAVLLEAIDVARELDAIVFKSPAVDLASAYLNEFGFKGMKAWGQTPGGTPLRAALYSVLRARGLASAPELTTNSLVLHGTEDEVVPFSQAELLAALLPRASLRAFPHGDHRFSDREQWQAVIDATIDHICAHIANRS